MVVRNNNGVIFREIFFQNCLEILISIKIVNNTEAIFEREYDLI